jgi:hypothetical protein
MLRGQVAGTPLLVAIAVIVTLSSQIYNMTEAGDEESKDCVPDTERQALIALYKSTEGDHWKNHNKWLGPQCTECDWYGIMCEPQANADERERFSHIIWIDLLENNLTGTLPSELGALRKLRGLDLLSNNLNGTLPVEFGDLDNLEELLIAGNHLTGKLPLNLLKRFDDGTLRLLGYAGQLSPIVQIELKYDPSAVICGDYEAIIHSDGSTILKTKVCRLNTPDDRSTFWETKYGFVDRYVGDFDRLARLVEVFEFYKMRPEYSEPITDGAWETITVVHSDGNRTSVVDYAESAPMNFWLLKRAIAGSLFNADWEKTERSKPSWSDAAPNKSFERTTPASHSVLLLALSWNAIFLMQKFFGYHDPC